MFSVLKHINMMIVCEVRVQNKLSPLTYIKKQNHSNFRKYLRTTIIETDMQMK